MKKNQADRLTKQHKKSKGVEGIFGDSDSEIEVLIEDKENEFLTMQSLLYEVKEHFGCYYSKHDKENLVIEVKKNDQV